jgi:hypothetical protein
MVVLKADTRIGRNIVLSMASITSLLAYLALFG